MWHAGLIADKLDHACMWFSCSGEKHGTTFLLNAVPSNGTSLPDMAARLQGQAQRFIDEPVSDQELARFCKVGCLGFKAVLAKLAPT